MTVRKQAKLSRYCFSLQGDAIKKPSNKSVLSVVFVHPECLHSYLPLLLLPEAQSVCLTVSVSMGQGFSGGMWERCHETRHLLPALPLLF